MKNNDTIGGGNMFFETPKEYFEEKESGEMFNKQISELSGFIELNSEDNVSLFNEFVQKQKETKEAWDLKIQREKELAEVQEKTERNEFIKYAKKLAKENKIHWKKSTEYAKEFKKATGRELQREIFKVFQAVFNNIRARSEEIYVEDDYKKFTVGPYGFGIRRNVQAQAIEHFYEMADIVSNKDEIIKGLRKNLVRGGDDWADKFEKFCDVVPDLDSLDSQNISVELDEPVRLPKDSYYDRGKAPKVCNTISFGERLVMLGIDDTLGEEDKDDAPYVNRDEFNFNLDQIRNGDDAVVYLQIHKKFAEYVERYVEKVKPTIEKSKTAVEKLQNEFGRELLLQEI